MSAQHTPGPWEVNRWNWPMEMSGRFHRVLNYERFPTAFIPAWSEPDPGEVDGSEEAQANARLIAAAPDLLEALRAVDVLFGHLARDSTQRIWLDNARAAIAKATAGV